jgi:Protein of unknown function (DUF3489)
MSLASYESRGPAMLNELSETRRLMLQEAAAREDRLLQPPANARGAAAKSIAVRLVDAGWAKEIKATKEAPTWRRDVAGGRAFALKLTAKGLKAIAGATETPADAAWPAAAVVGQKAEARATSREREPLAALKAATSNDRPISAIAIRPPRGGSKLDRVLVMLSSGPGATVGDLMSETGWLEHSTRAALTGLRRRGYQLSLTRGERDGASVYRIPVRGGEETK